MPLRGELVPVTRSPHRRCHPPKSGIKSIQDYIAAARERPGKPSGPSACQASAVAAPHQRASAARIRRRARHPRPLRRGGGPLQDLIAGTIDAGVVTFSAGAEQAAAGQLVALASQAARGHQPSRPCRRRAKRSRRVSSRRRGSASPRPQGDPTAIQTRIHAAATAVLKESATIERLRILGFDPAGLDGAAFGKLFDQTVATFEHRHRAIDCSRRLAHHLIRHRHIHDAKLHALPTVPAVDGERARSVDAATAV